MLLEAAADPAPPPEAEAILSEVLALRKIMINLLYGEKAGERLDRERMRELIESTDAGKLAIGRGRDEPVVVRTVTTGV